MSGADNKAGRSRANANLHTLGGSDLTDQAEPRYREYRRRWQEQPERLEPGSFPLFADIEATNYCNCRCTFCATTYFGPEVRRGYMDLGLYKEILAEGKSRGLYGIKLNDRGEPLLHPDLVEMVSLAKQAGLIDVYFNTNAMLLDEAKARGLVEAGLDRISVSFEGTVKSVYESYRVGAIYEQVLANVRRLRDIRNELGADRPKIRVQSVTVPEMETAEAKRAYADFWSPAADEVCVLDLKEESAARKPLLDFPHSWACPQLFQRVVVWWDGSILPCNEDDRGRLTLGKFGEMGLEQAWRCDRIASLRQAHAQGRAHTVAACNQCYLRDSEIKKLLDKET